MAAPANDLARSLVKPGIAAPDRGLVADGVTDTLAALRRAVAEQPRLALPAGTYHLPFTDQIALVPPPGAHWRGEGPGRTILRFVPGDTAYHALIGMARDGLILEDLSIELVAGGGLSTSVSMINAAGGLLCRNVWFDGGMSDHQGAVSHLAMGIVLPDAGVQEDIRVEGCRFARMAFPILKTNHATSVQHRVTLRDSVFAGNYGESWSLNSPNGAMLDVAVLDNSFVDQHPHFLGRLSLHVCLVGVKGFRVSGNHFAGRIGQAIHVEENCEDGEISGNRAVIAGTFLEIVQNDVAAGPVAPRRMLITGNVAHQTGAPRAPGTLGISLASTPPAGRPPARTMIVANNVMAGFDIGYGYAAEPIDGVLMHHNLAEDCATGFRIQRANPGIADNVSRQCGCPVWTQFGGILRNHTILDCAGFAETMMVPLAFDGLQFRAAPFAIEAGEHKPFAIVPLSPGSRIEGDAIVTAVCEAQPDNGQRRQRLAWDGITLSIETRAGHAPGAVVPSLVAQSGVLALSAYSAAPRKAIHLAMSFAGMITLSPA